MPRIVSELISIGGRSLEDEEQFQRSVLERQGAVGGILGVNLTCFPQYVFSRAILPKYHSKLEFTLDGRRVGELEVKFQRKKYFFILDYWKEEPLAPLQEDVDRLSKQKAEAYLLVFSANPYGETEGRLRLIDGLSGVERTANVHRFGAKTDEGEDSEFWVGGWKVASKPRLQRSALRR